MKRRHEIKKNIPSMLTSHEEVDTHRPLETRQYSSKVEIHLRAARISTLTESRYKRKSFTCITSLNYMLQRWMLWDFSLTVSVSST